MRDTPAEIRQKQAAIFNKMTTGERIAVCLTMAEEGRRLVEMKIEEKHPDWSRGKLWRRLLNESTGIAIPQMNAPV